MCHDQVSKRLIVRVLLVSLAPFALDGCVSVGLSRSVREGAPSGTGEVGVAIYQKGAPSRTRCSRS